jgi:hypothetical protein
MLIDAHADEHQACGTRMAICAGEAAGRRLTANGEPDAILSLRLSDPNKALLYTCLHTYLSNRRGKREAAKADGSRPRTITEKRSPVGTPRPGCARRPRNLARCQAPRSRCSHAVFKKSGTDPRAQQAAATTLQIAGDLPLRRHTLSMSLIVTIGKSRGAQCARDQHRSSVRARHSLHLWCYLE